MTSERGSAGRAVQGVAAKIACEQVSWAFHTELVLDGIDIQIASGSFTSIIGPNGSGKTTLLRRIARLLSPGPGRIAIDGMELTTLTRNELARKMGIVHQSEGSSYHFTVYDAVMMGRYPHVDRFSPYSSKDIQHVEKAMGLTGTTHLRDHLITEVSGGEHRRILIARALAQGSDLMILDEPTAFLDPHHQLEILSLLRDLVEERQVTIVCVLHDLNSALVYSDQVIMLNRGRVHAAGPPEEVITLESLKTVYAIEGRFIPDPFTGRPHIVIDTGRKSSTPTSQPDDVKTELCSDDIADRSDPHPFDC